jgi:2-polyprenyl-3-methyl-5-hydroxy-6-metoxy-1,4-benzoquinol methylase
MQKIRVCYYGHVFDSSGYGNAARAYIHAMNAAGVDLSVINLSNAPPQVRDELVESLIGRLFRPDFHLFHGIPHVWARQAFRVPNSIAMTVWETDTMPLQWCNTLNHALEVWLPCDFNLAAFRRHVRKPLAKIPHPVPQRDGVTSLPDVSDFLHVSPEDFVVYSIFEWQDRKSPIEQIKCYLNAFRDTDAGVFILKLNPGTAAEAESVLEETRRELHSSARVDLRCESWDEAEIVALHRRGDCYLSLHRGEGWCYPLFEAACCGTPVVATAYSGPLEYLDAEHHQLVPYRLTSVRQRYLFYHPGMRWAEPDVAEAALRLKWIFENRDEARRRAAECASSLNARYSMQQIGTSIRTRLIDLLQRTNPSRLQLIRKSLDSAQLRPSAPIPGVWYDADYFESGMKSNWTDGYRWNSFAGLFRDMASYVTGIFPCSESFLDAGCAKGFLVKSLRAAGKQAWGFDVSPWALANSEAEVRPYLRLAAAEEVWYDREFDALLAFDLLAHLSEAQIRSFLCNSREWTRTGLLAVIPTYDQPGAESPDDNDLSHVTRQTRTWWHERFLDCGWRQDPLHREMQRFCQNHELPSRIGWSIYLYSPRER